MGGIRWAHYAYFFSHYAYFVEARSWNARPNNLTRSLVSGRIAQDAAALGSLSFSPSPPPPASVPCPPPRWRFSTRRCPSTSTSTRLPPSSSPPSSRASSACTLYGRQTLNPHPVSELHVLACFFLPHKITVSNPIGFAGFATTRSRSLRGTEENLLLLVSC